MKSRCWSIAFDPNFVAAKRSKKIGKTAIQKIDNALQDTSPPLAVHGAYEVFFQNMHLQSLLMNFIFTIFSMSSQSVMNHMFFMQFMLAHEINRLRRF